MKIQRPNWSGIPHTGGESTRVSSFSTPSPCCFTMIKLHKTSAYIYYVRAFSEYSIPLCDVFRRGVNGPEISQRRSRLTCWTTRWKRSAETTWDNWSDDRNTVIKCNVCALRHKPCVTGSIFTFSMRGSFIRCADYLWAILLWMCSNFCSTLYYICPLTQISLVQKSCLILYPSV